jgi:IS30 family transposase
MVHKKYEHISRSERDRIDVGVARNESGRSIARALGRSASTISREITRNREEGRRYLPDTASTLAARRRWGGSKIERQRGLRDYITAKLVMEQRSPERIAGRMKAENQPFYACAETIYQFIYSPAGKADSLFAHLWKAKPKRTGKQCRKPRKSTIPARVSIHDRPPEIGTRATFGHWEGDLVIYPGRANLITLRERKTRFVCIAKNPSKHKENTMALIRAHLKILPKSARKSVTFDNGGEFAAHEKLHPLGCQTYFCDAHSPWQKGAIENANGVIRHHLPHRTNLAAVSHAEVDLLARKINNTPLKCLGYKTPTEALLSEINGCCTSNQNAAYGCHRNTFTSLDFQSSSRRCSTTRRACA